MDEFDISEGESFDFDDSEAFGDDLDVVDDVMGEDDELDDMDVFDAGDEDFADSFAGASEAEFISPSLPADQLAIPVEVDWGIATLAGLTLTTLIMVGCCIVMFDFVSSMWSWSEPTGFSSTIMDTLGGLFKK